jgi:hypothetical protein
MAVSPRRRIGAVASLVAVLASVALPVPAHAADVELQLPAGLACEFELGLSITGGSTVPRDFTDAEGNTVWSLSAGTGSAITFTNLSNSATLSLKSNGAVSRTTWNADGSSTVQSTGHNVLLLFPTDVPAGPSTTLYVGRVTYDVSAEGVFTLLSTSGASTDICAALEE